MVTKSRERKLGKRINTNILITLYKVILKQMSEDSFYLKSWHNSYREISALFALTWYTSRTPLWYKNNAVTRQIANIIAIIRFRLTTLTAIILLQFDTRWTHFIV